ncbi:hypothetical protein TIFTF001_017678 [Ficus carica]|uniref:Uncharacterized protein n=1 Tax=Ficus carica TaxID=3494 RepID=A0AA88A2S7_FICCA|nr:hypothetical protein TIFTF001_017678 [Ficus carica]
MLLNSLMVFNPRFVWTAAVMVKPVPPRDVFGVFSDVFPAFYFFTLIVANGGSFFPVIADESEGVEKWRFRGSKWGREKQ